MTICKSILAAAASAAALTVAPALSAGDRPAGFLAQMEPAPAQDAQRMRLDNLLGREITTAAGEEVGDIESVIVDESGKIRAVIVGVGGFLGLGERLVAMDWKDLQLRDNGRIIQSNLSREELKALPPYEYERVEQRGTAFVDRRYRERRADGGGSRAAAGREAEWTGVQSLKISNLLGASVVNGQGETIGEVEEILVERGRTALVLSVGEFLGIGGQSVTLDLANARLQQRSGKPEELRVVVGMSKEEMKSLPKYDAGAPQDRGGGN